MDAKKIRDQNSDQLRGKENVVLVGLGHKHVKDRDTGKLSIVVGVSTKKPLSVLPPKDVVPPVINGVPTDVEETGEIWLLSQPTAVDRTVNFRPAPGGVSIGHESGPTGTMACAVRKKGKWYILSNHHVFAEVVNEAVIGSGILQRGYVDGGRADTDMIARLSEFVEIEMDGVSTCPMGRAVVATFNFLARSLHRKTRLPVAIAKAQNTVDCALALPVRDGDVLDTILEDDGRYVRVFGETEPRIGLAVKKSGRTTGTTHGHISLVDVDATVNLGGGKVATFVDQFAVPDFGKGGDSGSLVCSEADQAAGLLFAGSATITLVNRWRNVRTALRLD